MHSRGTRNQPSGDSARYNPTNGAFRGSSGDDRGTRWDRQTDNGQVWARYEDYPCECKSRSSAMRSCVRAWGLLSWHERTYITCAVASTRRSGGVVSRVYGRHSFLTGSSTLVERGSGKRCCRPLCPADGGGGIRSGGCTPGGTRSDGDDPTLRASVHRATIVPTRSAGSTGRHRRSATQACRHHTGTPQKTGNLLKRHRTGPLRYNPHTLEPSPMRLAHESCPRSHR